MWWIIGIAIVFLFLFCSLFIKGSDMKNRGEKTMAYFDNEQEKIVSNIMKKG